MATNDIGTRTCYGGAELFAISSPLSISYDLYSNLDFLWRFFSSWIIGSFHSVSNIFFELSLKRVFTGLFTSEPRPYNLRKQGERDLPHSHRGSRKSAFKSIWEVNAINVLQAQNRYSGLILILPLGKQCLELRKRLLLW